MVAAQVVVVVEVKGVAPLPQDREVTVFVPVAGTRNHTWLDSHAIKKSAKSAARRWFVRGKCASLTGFQRPVKLVYMLRSEDCYE